VCTGKRQTGGDSKGLLCTPYIGRYPLAFAGIVRAADPPDNELMPLLTPYKQPAVELPYNLMTSSGFDCSVAIAEDPFVRRYIRALLLKHGFHIVENDAPMTRKMMEAGELKPDVLVTNEPALFAAFAQEVSVVYVAATPDPALVKRFRLSRVLRKPFDAAQLVRAVSELAAAAPA
jgi:hypothetical protein